MSIRSLSLLALRLLAVYTMIQSLSNLSRATAYILPSISNLGSDFSAAWVWVSITPAIVLGLSSILLWVFSAKWSASFVHSSEVMGDSQIAMDFKTIQALAFSVVGIILLVAAIPEIFRLVPNIMMLNQSDWPRYSVLKWQVVFAICEVSFKLILGFLLLLGSSGLARFLHRIKGIGTES